MSIGYCRPDSIAEAAALSAAGGRILAGGQSLMPLVNRGEVDAVDLIDINRLAGLDTIVMQDGFIEIGALARLESVRRHPLIAARLPMLAAALAWVANPAIRLRGTLVGNLVQFAAGAEAVAVAMLSAARLVTPDGRTHAPGALPDASFATHVRLDPSPVATRAGFIELQRRSGHLGTVGCGVAALPNGAYQVVFSGLLEAPLPAPVVAAELARGGHDRSRIATALAHDLAGRTPRSDLHADAAYRLAVAPVLVGRVVAQLEAAT